MPERSAKLYLRHRSGDHDLILRRGCSASLRHFTDLSHRRVLVAAAAGLPAGMADALLGQCEQGVLCTLPGGARGRGLSGVELVLAALAENGFARGDLVVGLGGSSLLGVAGFAAAVYLGGVDFVSVPTSTCAQLCACGGSMLGVNLEKPGFRAGVSRAPRLVLVDADLADSQPEVGRRNGLAWAMQMALTVDPELFALLEAETLDMDEVLYRVLNDKKKLMDQYPDGEAPVLDFGGALARALWRLYGRSGRRTRGLGSGECLFLAMTALTKDKALARDLRAVCRREGLSSRAAWNREKVLAALAEDPTWENGALPLITVPGLGCWEMNRPTAAELKEYL